MRYEGGETAPQPFEEEIELFLAVLGPSVSANTVRAHRATLRHFTDWYVVQPLPTTLTAYFQAHPGWAVNTRRNNHSRLQRFLTFASKSFRVDPKVDPALLGTLNPHALVGPAPGVVEKILKEIPDHQERDALLFRLMYGAGLRVTEATALRVRDVYIVPGHSCAVMINRSSQAGSQELAVKIADPDLISRLEQHLSTRKDLGELLFQASKTNRARPLRQQNLHRRWRQYAQKAGVSCSLEELRLSSPRSLYPPRG